jgi:photosystem II stability/assembly factor-like uncharacterized protein
VDSNEEPELSRRARRAIALIATSLTVMAVGSLLYLKAGDQPKAAAPSPIQALDSRYHVSYFFLNPSLGWAIVGDAWGTAGPRLRTFRTVDGAKHWEQLSAIGLTQSRADVRFFDLTHGVLVVLARDGPHLYRTFDGGINWRTIAVPLGSSMSEAADFTHLWAVAWPDPQKAVAKLYSTADGGQTWTPRSWPEAAIWLTRSGVDLVNIHFRSNGEGWLIKSGMEPAAYVTEDGGDTWQVRVISVGVAEGYAYATQVRLLPVNGVIVVVNKNTGLNRSFTSFDHGATWQPVTLPPEPLRHEDILYVDSTHWWAWRFTVLSKTSDAGHTWRDVQVGKLLDTWLYYPRVIDSNHAWALMTSTAENSRTALAMSSDGGVTWNPVSIPTPRSP